MCHLCCDGCFSSLFQLSRPLPLSSSQEEGEDYTIGYQEPNSSLFTLRAAAGTTYWFIVESVGPEEGQSEECGEISVTFASEKNPPVSSPPPQASLTDEHTGKTTIFLTAVVSAGGPSKFASF